MIYYHYQISLSNISSATVAELPMALVFFLSCYKFICGVTANENMYMKLIPFIKKVSDMLLIMVIMISYRARSDRKKKEGQEKEQI